MFTSLQELLNAEEQNCQDLGIEPTRIGIVLITQAAAKKGGMQNKGIHPNRLQIPDERLDAFQGQMDSFNSKYGQMAQVNNKFYYK